MTKIPLIPTNYMVQSYVPARKIKGALLIRLFRRSSVDRPLVLYAIFGDHCHQRSQDH